MKIFLSWSGDKSMQVASIMKDWLSENIQQTKPWISRTGIAPGGIWIDIIFRELSETNFGIIFITNSNKNAPWILFEAGALGKGLLENNVVPLLIDIATTDLEPPLSQFNAVKFTKESIRNLVISINAKTDSPMSSDVINRVFEKNWPELEQKFKEISDSVEPNPLAKRSDSEKIDELLTITRGLIRSAGNRSTPFLPPHRRRDIDDSISHVRRDYVVEFTIKDTQQKEVESILKKSLSEAAHYYIVPEVLDNETLTVTMLCDGHIIANRIVRFLESLPIFSGQIFTIRENDESY